MWRNISPFRNEYYNRVQFVLISIIISLAGAEAVFSQTQCAQKLSELPAATELFGFRLGMTRDEVKTLVPQTVFGRTDDFGVAKTTINPNFDPRIEKTRFAGVRSISLDFLDDRLTSLWIGYDETYKVQTIDDLVKLISQSLRLSGAWSSWRSKGQQLRCGDFQVIVSMVAAAPTVRILDVGAENIVAERRLAKEERDAEAAAATPAGAAAEPSEIIGDKKTKLFYPTGCRPLKEIAEENKIVFESIDEAQKSGFKLASNCQ